MLANVLCRTERHHTGSHFAFEFLHKPIAYCVACLLYGFVTSVSVTILTSTYNCLPKASASDQCTNCHSYTSNPGGKFPRNISSERHDVTGPLTFLSFITFLGISPYQTCLQEGHCRLEMLYFCATLWSMEANGVTPIPLPINTACSVSNTSRVPVPNGPSRKHCQI